METHFAPAERTDVRVFRQQVEAVSSSPVMTTLLDTMAGLLVVLNEDCQIVALNHAFLATLGIADPDTRSLACVWGRASDANTPMRSQMGAAPPITAQPAGQPLP